MSPQVQIVYYTGPYTRTVLPVASALLARLNPERRRRFEQRIDGPQRALDLAALRLLEIAMQRMNYAAFRLSQVNYPVAQGVSGKPYWADGAVASPMVDFSLSHANGIAACAVSVGCRVGLDAEAARRIEPRTIARLLREDATLQKGLDASNALARWTQVEAVIKGAGLGIMHGREIEWRDDATLLRGVRWWLHDVSASATQPMHVAVDAPNVRICSDEVCELD